MLVFVFWFFGDQPQSKLSAREAHQHIGQHATVCGVVASARYAPRTKGQPTFLNLEKPYPNQIFTILIWGEDRSKFGKPEITFADKSVCVSGEIRDYRGEPEIVTSSPTQISLQ